MMRKLTGGTDTKSSDNPSCGRESFKSGVITWMKAERGIKVPRIPHLNGGGHTYNLQLQYINLKTEATTIYVYVYGHI